MHPYVLLATRLGVCVCCVIPGTLDRSVPHSRGKYFVHERTWGWKERAIVVCVQLLYSGTLFACCSLVDLPARGGGGTQHKGN